MPHETDAEDAAAPVDVAPGKKKIVLVKGKAGLGNRMLCAVTAFLYARMTGRMAIIDWRDFTYSNDGSNVFPRLFDSAFSADIASLPPTGSIRPAVWKGKLEISASELTQQVDPSAHDSYLSQRHLTIDVSRTDYDEDLLIMWSFTHLIEKLRANFKGPLHFLQQYSTGAILRWGLLEFMPLNQTIAAEIKAWRAQSMPKGPIIGVHIRHSDKLISLPAIFRALDRIKAEVPEASIFLSTDSKKAESLITARYGQSYAMPKWFPAAGASMHQNNTCPDRFQNAVEGLKDMYMLSDCDHLIYSSASTFSVISALLSGAPKHQIIDIERRNPRTMAKKLLTGLMHKYL
jgi:Nodulation protein Z (NodZ)